MARGPAPGHLYLGGGPRLARPARAPGRGPGRLPGPPEARNSRTPPLIRPTTQRESAALMRVNHAGEVAAQALYHGQALFARNAEVREFCSSRARGDRPPRLVRDAAGGARRPPQPARIRSGTRDRSRSARSPALLGDRASLGFVAETERQVEGHLDESSRAAAARRSAQPRDRRGHVPRRRRAWPRGAKRRGGDAAGTRARTDAANGADHDAYCVLVLAEAPVTRITVDPCYFACCRSKLCNTT